MPNLPLIVVRHPLSGIGPEQVDERSAEATLAVAAALTTAR